LPVRFLAFAVIISGFDVLSTTGEECILLDGSENSTGTGFYFHTFWSSRLELHTSMDFVCYVRDTLSEFKQMTLINRHGHSSTFTVSLSLFITKRDEHDWLYSLRRRTHLSSLFVWILPSSSSSSTTNHIATNFFKGAVKSLIMDWDEELEAIMMFETNKSKQ
jgi:hypothetical protein